MHFEAPQVKPDELALQFLLFRIGDQELLLEIHRVQEVLRYRPVTPFPTAPSFVEGMIQVRGNVIAVLNMRMRLGMGEAKCDSSSRILVVRAQRMSFGFVVDEVDRVLPVDVADIQPPPEAASTSPLILGVVNNGRNLALILDLERLISGNEILMLPQLIPSSRPPA